MFNLHNVRVKKQAQQLDLPQDPSSVRDVVKDIVDLLDSNSFSGVGVNSRTNNSIASFANYLLDLIPVCFSILSEEVRIRYSLKIQCQIRFKLSPKHELGLGESCSSSGEIFRIFGSSRF